MWSVLSKSTQVVAIVAFTVLTVLALEAVASALNRAELQFYQLIGLVSFLLTSVVTFIASVVWKRVWKAVPLLSRVLFPDLSGEWSGTLESTWIDPETNKGVLPIPIKVTITQGLFATSVTLRTKESTSYSHRCFLEAFPDSGRFRIWYTYSNNPNAIYQYRSKPHDGVAWLEFDANACENELTGSYFTARKTTGDLKIERNPIPEE